MIPIRERVQREAKTVAVEADRPNHLLARPQDVVLVMVARGLTTALALGHVAGRAAHPGARFGPTGELGQPKLVVGAPRIGAGMGVVVTVHARLDRGGSDIDTVRPVTSAAIERQVHGIRTHGKPRLADAHSGGRRRISQYCENTLGENFPETQHLEGTGRVARLRDFGMPAHAVPAEHEGLRFLLVAVLAGEGARGIRPVGRDTGKRGVCGSLRRVTGGAIDAGRGVAGKHPGVDHRGRTERGGRSHRILTPERRFQGGLPAALTRGHAVHRSRREPFAPAMLDEEVLVERPVVVVIVTPGGGTGVEGKARVARPVLAHILFTLGVTGDAEVHCNGDRARPRDLGEVLLVT